MKKFIQSDRSQVKFPSPGDLISLLGVFFYFFKSLSYAQSLFSTLDEGNYLYKGLLFATGVYKPFQPYGPITGTMPLSFLIPGWVQTLFGPGIRTGRYFAVALGVIMLVALWYTARRLSNSWWAVFVVWAIALNPFLEKIYSQVFSEGLAATMLALVLALSLGKKRSLWQITTASFIASLIVLTRQNLFPIMPFLILYCFWEHGKKAGLFSLFTSAITLISFHVYYYPEILLIWLKVLPGFLAKPFSNLIFNPDATRTWQTQIQILGRLLSFWDGIRLHFLAISGAIFSWIFWPRKNDWEDQSKFRSAVFLTALFATLFIMHTWASIFRNYCVFCFPNYLAFFSEISLILFILTTSNLSGKTSVIKQTIAGIILVLITTGIGFSTYQDIGKALLQIQIPRIRELAIQPGTTELWRLLSNKFNLSFKTLEYRIPAAFGLSVGISIIVIGTILRLIWKKQRKKLGISTTSFLLLIGLGMFLTPTMLLGNRPSRNECTGNLIPVYESVGAYLNNQIPPGSKVWWWSSSGPVPLLYLEDTRIFSPQLNHRFNYFIDGDSQRLYEHGYWNEELALKWLRETDFALIEGKDFYGDVVEWINPDLFDELLPSKVIHECETGAYYRIFRRKR
jgi:hypothetical protein